MSDNQKELLELEKINLQREGNFFKKIKLAAMGCVENEDGVWIVNNKAEE